MKINFFLLIFLFIYSCSSKFEKDMSLDNLKMEGTSYLESSKKDKILGTVKNISNISVYPMEKIYNWNHYNLNA